MYAQDADYFDLNHVRAGMSVNDSESIFPEPSVIVLKGFNDPDQVKSSIESKLSSILEKAPSDASSEVEVTRDENGCNGFLRIVSCEGRFFAEGKSGEVTTLFHELLTKVYDQIRKWRTSRSDGAGLPDADDYELATI